MSELDDILGISGMGDADDDVSGLDPEEVGALAIRNLSALRTLAKASPAQATRLVQQQQANDRARLASLATTGRQPTQPMGMSSRREYAAGIPAGGTREITITPKADVRIVALTVADSIADAFDIEDILVDRKSVMLSGDPVPASRYKASAERPPFQAQKCKAGIPISISVTNMTGEVQHFSAVFDCIEL